MSAFEPRLATINLKSWGGASGTVLVVGETPKRYRVKSPDGSRVQLAGEWHCIEGDETRLVPKYAVRFLPDAYARVVSGTDERACRQLNSALKAIWRQS